MENNKDEVIIKYEQLQAEKTAGDLKTLSESTSEQEKRLIELQKRLATAKEKGAKTSSTTTVHELKKKPTVFEVQKTELPASYDDLYENASNMLMVLGTDPEDVSYHDLISEEELNALVKELNEPLPKEEKWVKGDFIVVFIAAFVGAVADFILGDRHNKFTGTGKTTKEANSKFSDWLNEIHETKWKHKPGAPIDYQGANFGGGRHRELSKGHDLLRFIDGIKMFKNGQFEGVYYEAGKAIKVVSAVNQMGTPYAQMGLIQAIIEYFRHMTADLFSTYSLPMPGFSFLRESDSRRLRTLSADLYKNGLNLKNVIIQSISTIIVELTIRIYYGIMSVKSYKDDVEIAEDFSNWEAVKRFAKPINQDKLNEMLLVAHAIVTAANVGKIVIKCIIAKNLGAVAQINITEIMSVVKYGHKVVKAVAKRNGEYEKLLYHSELIRNGWKELDDSVTQREIDVLSDMDVLVV